MTSVDFSYRINYTNNFGKNLTQEFYDSDFIQEASIQKITSFKLLKKIVENFSKTCNDINYYVFSIIVNEQKFELISIDMERILKLEGFRSYGSSGGADSFPVSIGIIDFHKKVRIEYTDGKFVFRDN